MNSNQRKKIIAVIFCLVQLFQSYAQTFSSDCHSDSLQTLQNEIKLEELSCRNEGFDRFARLYIYILKKSHDRLDEPNFYCDIPMFAKLFDFLLLHGLDLNYDFINDIPRNLFLHAVDPKARAVFDSIAVDQQKKNVIFQRQRDLFFGFVMLNEYYSEKIILSFEENPNINIENIIHNIKLYGSLSYPNQVSSILRGDYRELTKEKFLGLPPKKPKRH